jgi:cell division transport system permease protein
MFSRIEFILTETFLGLRRHPLMAFAAISCIAATLFVAGMMALMFFNARHAINTAMNRVKFVVFFHPDASRDDTQAAYQKIRHLDRIAEATFIPKEQEWEKLQKEDPDYTRLLDKNPLPDSVSVRAMEVNAIPALTNQIRQWDEVDSVKEAPEVATVLDTLGKAMNNVGVVVGIILLFLSLVIVHHTIELTLYARRKEIHIMSLVGAAPSTVAMPFLLEGLLYGVIGGGLAFGVLVLIYHYVVQWVMSHYGTSLFQDPQLFNQGMLALLVAGLILGLSGSLFSVLKYLYRPQSKMTNS